MFKKTLLWVTSLATILGITGAVVSASVTFIDLKKSHWAHDYIMWGVEEGVLDGYPDKTFKPEKSVTEAEFIKILISLYEGELKGEKEWYDGYYERASELGWKVPGIPVEMFKNEPINRATTAVIINNALGYTAESYDDYILNLYELGLSEGKHSKTVEGFAGEVALSRAEAITFLKRVYEAKLIEKFAVDSEIITKEESEFLTSEELLESLELSIKDESLKVYKTDTTTPGAFLFATHRYEGLFVNTFMINSEINRLDFSHAGTDEAIAYISEVLSNIGMYISAEDIKSKYMEDSSGKIGDYDVTSTANTVNGSTIYRLSIQG